MGNEIQVTAKPHGTTRVAVADADGNIIHELADGERVVIYPRFYTAQGLTPMLDVETLNDVGETVDSTSLVISGSTGKVKHTDRDVGAGVTPKFAKGNVAGGDEQNHSDGESDA